MTGSAFTTTGAYADQPDPGTPGADQGKTGDIQEVGPDYNDGKKMPLDKSGVPQQKQRMRTMAATAAPTEGDTRIWLANDDVDGSIYLKEYTLRGMGDHIQVWVADDRAFPEGDCRNDLGLTDVTDEQVDSFVHEFDTNIYPKESDAFSTPPSLDGSNATLPGLVGLPADYYQVPDDQSDDIVVLVDNVVDANYYDPSTPDGQTYIAGFFYSVFNDYTDRNIMTIDAYDWLHRTGANPPDNSADADYQDCAAASGAPRPHLYEGVFAHEYQHLLEHYEDPDEESWINEGLSDWAQTLVGYVDPSLPPDEPGADSHLACFQGFSDPAFGGAENSLTEWGDQGGPEILCDYGAAYAFMEYLQSHYGNDFMSTLHREDGNGLAGLDAVLDQFGSTKSAQETLHDWAAAMALDSVLEQGRKLTGGDRDALSIDSMSARINWENPQNYESPGAPPNGSDYVRLADGAGKPLTAKQLSSITFDGDETLAPDPVEWTTVTPPDATTDGMACGQDVTEGTGPEALYSGCGNMLDRSIAREVSVPEGGATLSFDALWDIEYGWDYGFVQVSTDGGQTWQSLATEDTVSETDPGALAAVKENVPGFSGDSGTWKTQTADLSAYAGQDVLVGFRYITDPAATEAGFWVRNIKVGDTTLPTTASDWQSYSQISPAKVDGFTVQLVAYDEKGRAWYHDLELDDQFRGSLSGAQLIRALGKQATTVAAIVTFDDPSEASTKYAGYSLTVNGVEQPGG